MDLKPTLPLGGFVELTPVRQRCFDECARRMRNVLRIAGFAHLELPSLERAEVLTDKENWDEIETQMFLFEKGGTKMGLRYDGTIGLARYVAGHMNDLAFPFRAYQFAKNYRGERPQKGRYREFFQMDLDVLGVNSLSLNYDAEIIAVISKAYASIKEFVGPVSIRVGSRALWNAMFEWLGLDAAKSREAFMLIDKKDKLGDGFGPALKDVFAGSALGADDAANEILSVFSNGYRGLRGRAPALDASIDELDGFARQLAAMGVTNAAIDLSVMRGHAYYTGIVFEVFLDRFPELGSVGGGGRYDGLVSKFSKTKIIGVGAAVGFSRMMVALLEDGRLDLAKFESRADAAVLVVGAENTLYAMTVLSSLRDKGIVAAPFLDADKKLKNQMEFADKIGAKFSVIIGKDEADNQQVSLKSMASGEQETVSAKDVAERIKSHLSGEHGL